MSIFDGVSMKQDLPSFGPIHCSDDDSLAQQKIHRTLGLATGHNFSRARWRESRMPQCLSDPRGQLRFLADMQLLSLGPWNQKQTTALNNRAVSSNPRAKPQDRLITC